MGLGSEIRDLDKLLSDPGVKKAPDPGSESAPLKNTSIFFFKSGLPDPGFGAFLTSRFGIRDRKLRIQDPNPSSVLRITY
jgi:hypothetical protein